uniref:PX domain-containing protein n=1 Tax=Trichuris muris TaxID=70415 RepID=A0A5S6R5C4_TRIMR
MGVTAMNDRPMLTAVMMHVSVPVYRFASDSSGQLYAVYEIHINGAYHCSCRYSTLLRLHELIARIDPDRVPEFPPKRIKAFLNERSLAERRDALQDYLRIVFYRKDVTRSQLVQRFFLDAQRESCVSASRQLSNQLPVYLLDGTKCMVPCFPGDSTGAVLERLAPMVGLSPENCCYFGLFIVTKSEVFPCKVLRWLGNFESPLLSLYQASKLGFKAKVVLRKSFWDASIENGLLNDVGAVRVILSQAQFDCKTFLLRNCLLPLGLKKLRYTSVDEEAATVIASANSTVNSIELLRLCQRQSWYGYVFFEQCQCSFPASNTIVHAAVGNKRLIILYSSGQDELKESVFRVNRIRCWRLSVLSTHGGQDLSFEYLFSNNHLEWITLKSAQSVLISLCLQSMIEEIVGSQATHGAADARLPLVPCASGAFLNTVAAGNRSRSERSPLSPSTPPEILMEPIRNGPYANDKNSET